MGKPGKKAGKGMLPPTNPNRRTDPTKTNLRDQRTIKRLKMYKSKIKRDEKGNIVKGSVLKASDRVQTQMARIAPDRRWFGNTRTIGQNALQEFRTEMSAKYKDPYSVIIKQSKLPLSLLEEPKMNNSNDGSIRQEMEWDKTFGDKATRKRVRLNAVDVKALAEQANEKVNDYVDGKINKDRDLRKMTVMEEKRDKSKNSVLFTKGQSNRIWCELFKVIDSSDVILYVVDARDPLGTRSSYIEEYMRKEKKYKHFVLILNKCDLVPMWVTARWLQVLSKDYPTIAFHASVNHPFGKGNVISLLRQFARLHNVTHRGSKRTKTPISVGIVGYPNVGKSSLINTLRRKAVCKVAPIPGETKVWQYVALTRSIFLIDCPGVVYDKESNNDVQAVLKGVVRVERLGNADKTEVVETVLQIVKRKDLVATYNVYEWHDVNDFLEKLAKLRGKLMGGGEADVEAAARMVLYDWQRGKLPWFNAPPFDSNAQYREATSQPASRQMKLIEHYSSFNIVDDSIEYTTTTTTTTSINDDNNNNNNDNGNQESYKSNNGEDNRDNSESNEISEDVTSKAVTSKKRVRKSVTELVNTKKRKKTNIDSNSRVNNDIKNEEENNVIDGDNEIASADADVTLVSYLEQQEEQERKRKRQEKRMQSQRARGDHNTQTMANGAGSNKDDQNVDALWAKFMAAASVES